MFQKTADSYVFDLDTIGRLGHDSYCPNHQAYTSLYLAIVMSGNPYGRPESREVALQLKEKLQMIRSLIADPHDELLHDYLNHLEDRVNWALRRHWRMSWPVILGVVLSILMFRSCSESRTKEIAAPTETAKKIENWTACDTTVAMDDLTKNPVLTISFRDNAINYKLFYLDIYRTNHKAAQRTANVTKARMDTCTNEKRMEGYRKGYERNTKEAEEYKKKYDELNAMTFPQVKQLALDEAQGYVQRKKDDAAFPARLMGFFLLLTPFYIFATRPYGYMINHCELNGQGTSSLQKIGFALAGGLGIATVVALVGAWVNNLLGNQNNRSGDEGCSSSLLGMIFILVVGVLVFCFTACFLMIISTVYGLITNYDLKGIYQQASEKIQQIQNKYRR